MLTLLILLAQPSTALPRAIPNPGFESDPDHPVGWQASVVRGYAAGVSTDRPFAGRRSAFLVYRARNGADRDGPAPTLSTVIDARRLRGRLIQVSAALRLPAAGAARLRVTYDGDETDRPVLGRDWFEGRDWSRAALITEVPRRARTLRITFEVSRGNDVEIDDVRLERAPAYRLTPRLPRRLSPPSPARTSARGSTSPAPSPPPR